MPLHDLLSRARVAILDGHAVETGASDGAPALVRVLAAAAWLLADGGNPAPLAQALREREARASTALGEGVAIPHARVAGLDECRAAFLRLEHPVEFEAPDRRPVDLVLALLVPEHDVTAQLHRLAEIADRFADPDYRAALRTARDASDLRRLLGGSGPDFLPCAA
ncbi:PTS sugar transporter subunit IIA [Lysobacter arvi]|uniref:PTS sugar transporter subunit IIA n=1 Tax=Lysobacter arvi TaxID=3038776 RepID=A0ABU1CE92_9GAMM|nr:PTS sugar transporter subunit IIA [Lysobacter arvi]MDR0183092.1 PTS sugar transporter subunit IIA [Lysobacter arvi]